MDKFLILRDGSRHRLNPLTFQEFLRADYCKNCKAADVLETYQKFKAVNGYVDIEDLSGGGVLSDAQVEVYDGDHKLTWNVHADKWMTVNDDPKGGFPADDEVSMQQGCQGTANLDIYYAHQFAQDEEVLADDPNSLMQWAGNPGDGNLDVFYNHSPVVENEELQGAGWNAGIVGVSRYVPFMLEHTPLLKGTMTGTVYIDKTAVQTFCHRTSGGVDFFPIGSPKLYAEKIEINEVTGEIGVVANELVEKNQVKLVVSYEYNLECQYDPKFKDWKYSPGFPSDDGLALQQLASGNGTLDLYYPHQYVQNEVVAHCKATGPAPNIKWKYHDFWMLPLEHGPVLEGSLVGKVYVDDKQFAMFIPSSLNNKEFNINYTPPTEGLCFETLKFDYETRRFFLGWSDKVDPATVKIVVSYEYDRDDLPVLTKSQVTIE